MNPSSCPVRSFPKRLVATATAAVFLTQPVGTAFAAILQTPALFTSPPDANVMFTLDDSGSMLSDVIPDPTSTTGMPNDSSSTFSNQAKYPYMWASGSTYYRTGYFHSGNGLLSTLVTTQSRIGRYLRSPTGNPLYYNPNITYKPWPKADDDTQLSAAASPTAVNVDDDNPFSPGYTVNLTTRVNINTLNTASLAIAPDNENDNYWRATYFKYIGTTPLLPGNPNQAANIPANFEKVEIKPSRAPFLRDSNPEVNKRTDCAAVTSCTYKEEIQNFANWLQYYHNRRLMAKGGVAAAFASQGTNLRLGFASINSNPVVRIGVAPFSGSNRTRFYNDLYALGNQSGTGTPLRLAMDAVGKYFQRSNIGNPWAQDPTNTSSKGIEYTCRKSFHILSTDGYWNDSTPSGPAGANNDNFSGTTPARSNGSSYTYSDSAPTNPTDPLTGRFGIRAFSDSVSGTLADVAAYYWKTDLRSDLVNSVSPSSRDPAFWQHLATFTVGLGLNGTGTVNKTNGGLADLSSQPARDLLVANRVGINWPVISGDTPSTGDDLIHASMNGHGAYFSASDPDALSNGISAALAEALDQSVTAANLANEAPLVSADSLFFQASYNSYRWAGRLYAFTQGADGVVNTTPASAQWEASNKMPAPASRNIQTWNPNNSSGTPFTWGGLNGTQRSFLGNDSKILDYLRGDGSGELQNGGDFRDRSRYTVGNVTGGVLGDIVNGSPIKGPSYGGGFDKMRPGQWGRSTYAEYRSDTNAALTRTANTIFAGANDGMLHGFNQANGVERFAYVANAFFNVPRSLGNTAEQKLKMLSDPGYTHRFTMDGPPQIADAFLGTADSITGWKTVLVSSAGAGARTVFGLDVSDAGAFTSGKVMWEFSEASSGGGDMGFVLKYPHVAKMRNGQWVAIFGNGYDSATGQAKLYILDLKTGAVVWQQAVGTAGGNGLSQPNFTVNANREVEAIYAGDLKGNLWKFDVDYEDPASWKVAFSGSPLFKAYNASQSAGDVAITVMPEIAYHPHRGTLVAFGTGRLFDSNDTSTDSFLNTNLKTQAIYGVWDKPGETAGVSGVSSLVEQTVNADNTGTSSKSVEWATKRGWFINLGSGGERVIVNPSQVKNVLFVVASKPVLPPDPCGSDGTSRVFGLDPVTGGAPTFGVFSSSVGNNVVTVASMLSQVLVQQKGGTASTSALQTETSFNNRGQTGALAGGVQVVAPGVQSNCKGFGSANQGNGSIFNVAVNLCNVGKARISWRQIK